MKPKNVKIYVAAPWRHRTYARDFAETLKSEGFTVTSRWLYHHGNDESAYNLCKEATHDWEDVKACDVLILLNLEKSEGKAVEQGLALELGKPIIAVGTPSNVFHYLPHYTWVSTVGKAIEAIELPEPTD